MLMLARRLAPGKACPAQSCTEPLGIERLTAVLLESVASTCCT